MYFKSQNIQTVEWETRGAPSKAMCCVVFVPVVYVILFGVYSCTINIYVEHKNRNVTTENNMFILKPWKVVGVHKI